MGALSYDGRGINGPAPDRERVATFTDSARADEWGPLLAAAPELLEALRDILDAVENPRVRNLREFIGKRAARAILVAGGKR
jgi:hypothetical protein